MRNVIELEHISVVGLFEILKLFFYNYIFIYDNTLSKLFYKQIRGIAMGSKAGSSIANLVV